MVDPIMHVIYCNECDSALGVQTSGTLEHHEDGSHTFTPSF